MLVYTNKSLCGCHALIPYALTPSQPITRRLPVQRVYMGGQGCMSGEAHGWVVT